ncbi:HIV Tat-specific factor 1 [Paragonimus westermani]|uniref:HIV Tat-specific factor 1 n=1 Tax=Paragonimus westermani TaxID=34504 RepID=A0A5J4NGC2_9TREM|nr:HIV Tat-specific factor 1 [Paragonimus westermani]
MSYGVATNQDEPSVTTATATAASHDGCMNWSSFNAQLAKLREAKGEQSEEVQALTRAAHESLTAYYNSPAYREWYANYCKQREAPEEDAKVAAVQPKSAKSTKLRTDLKPSERVRQALATDGEDAEIALARAEAEQQAGVPLCVEQDATNLQSDQTHELIDKKSGDSNASKPATKRKQAAPPPAWYEMEDDKNTHVYVTGLPPEITEEEFLGLMSKYGVVMNEPFVDKPRIKLYRDEHGKPKGDGRCCYVKVESVELALKILDGMVYTPGHTLHVERAKFQPKGTFDPKKRRRLTLKEKKRLKEQQENLFRWGVDTSKFVRSKKERVLVLKNAFLEFDFVRDVTLIPCVRDRIRTECAKCGTVKKIVVHDTNPLGIVTVTFSSPEEADTALGFLDKALFNYPGTGGARQLLVERWDGKTNYSLKEDKDEELSRIHNWEKFLGGDQSSSDEGDELQEKDAEIEAVMTAHKHLEASTELAADYWEASSQESPTSQIDTDEASGNSGDETA